MKSLLIVLALVAYVSADDSVAAYEQCLNETIRFKQCAEGSLIKSAKELFEDLGKFREEIGACLKQDLVRDNCKLNVPLLPGPGGPPPGGPPQGGPPQGGPPQGVNPKFAAAAPPAPDPKEGQCLMGVGQQFGACFLETAKIPQDVIKALKQRVHDLAGAFPGGPGPLPGGPGPHPGAPGGPGGPPPIPFGIPGFGGPGGPDQAHAHFINGSIQDIKAKTLKICGDNQEAADKLVQCGFGVAGAHFESIFAILHPLSIVCKAVGPCATSSPISADCQSKLKNAGDAFCSCNGKKSDFFKATEACSSVSEGAAEKFIPPQLDAVCAHKDKNLEQVCQEIQQTLDTIKEKIKSHHQ